ncbi:MAG: T9SS type A sorting domain-containing protein [Candidatus Pacebacteria bacterium]|jgi:hypothetical protein|nr:T9SS type A sorting domain-containing protein [Candidatus Paceibacterota bacterium]
MKKLLYSLAIAGICIVTSVATPTAASAQICVNYVQINAKQFQAGGTFLAQSGEAQNELPGALFYGQKRYGKVWNIHQRQFEDLLPYNSLLDSCIGAGATHFTDLSTMHMLDVIQYRVTLVPVDVPQMFSGISTHIKLPWRGNPLGRMVELNPEYESGTQLNTHIETLVVTGANLPVTHDAFLENRTINGDKEDTDFSDLLEPLLGQLFPISGNPGSTITIQNPYEVPFSVRIVNLSGSVVATAAVDGGTFSFVGDEYANGIYFFDITITDEPDARVVHRVILQK